MNSLLKMYFSFQWLNDAITVELTRTQERLPQWVGISLLYNTMYLPTPLIVQLQNIYIVTHKKKIQFPGNKGCHKTQNFLKTYEPYIKLS